MNPLILLRFCRARWAVALIGLCALAACGGGGGAGAPPVATLTLTSPSASLGAGTSLTVQAGGGQTPYLYSVVSGGGSIDSSGLFTAPETAGTIVVEVTDARGTTAKTSLQVIVVAFVHAAASVDPATTTLQAASGGATPYTYMVLSGGGSIDASGHYSAPASAAQVTLEVTDAHGGTAQESITVNSPLLASAPAATIGGGTTLALAATGGQGPFAYAMVSGAGSVDSSGHFTAPQTPGTSVVSITDALGVSVSVTVTINPPLAISPASATLTASSGQSTPFVGTNGVPPYHYMLVSGGGTLSAQGLYTVGTSSGLSSVQVTDSQGTTVVAPVRALRIRVNGAVFATANDGTNLYVGGRFNAVNPYSAPRLAIVDASSGNINSGCDLGSGFLDGNVTAVATLGNAIYVAGDFGHYRGAIVGKLAKIDATSCALDTTFTRSGGFGQELGSSLYTLALAGSSLFVSGNVTTYRGLATSNVLKLDATTGDPDPAFNQAPSGNNGGASILVSSGAALYAGGDFTTFSGVAAPYLVKLDAATGALDKTFAAAPGADGPVLALAVAANTLYVGGSFTHYASSPAGLVRVDATSGVVDSAFSQNVANYSQVDAVLVSGSSIYVGLQFPGSGTPTLSKIDATAGTADPTFNAGAGFNSGVTSLLLSGSNLYVGGYFATYRGFAANNLAKLDAISGALDTVFTQTTGGNLGISSLAMTGAQLVAGGGLTTYRGTPASNVAKFALATDTVDSAFNSAVASNSNVVAMTLNGSSLYLGGYFGGACGSSSFGIMKVDTASGTCDTVFAAGGGAQFAINTMLIHGNSLYIGGAGAGHLAKMDLISGRTDSGFAANGSPDGDVYALTDTATAIYAGGKFQNYGASPARNLVKVDPATGMPDPVFTQATGAGASTEYVFSLAAIGNSIYAGGTISSYRGAQVQALVKVDATSGVLDSTFTHSQGFFGDVEALLKSGSSLYVAGALNSGTPTYRGTPTFNISKVDAATGNLDATFSSSLPCDSCSVNFDSLSLNGTQLFIGADATTLYRGSASYNVFPVDASTGAPTDP